MNRETDGRAPAWVKGAGQAVIGPVFYISAAVILGFVLTGVVFSAQAETVFPQILRFISDTFGWFYILAVAFFFVFVVYLAASSLGRIKLGPDDSEPDYTYTSWFAMLFSAGMGIGLVFFGVAEPIMHYSNPPVGEGGTLDSARDAMRLTFFHWGLHAWAIYIVVGLALAYFAFRHNLPLTIRSALYPILGDRIHGPIGHMVDIFAVVGTMFGVATSLGLGVMQVNSGLNHLFGVPVDTWVQVLLIAGITGLATISVVSGLDKGIKRISELNLLLAVLLLSFVLLAGPTLDLLRSFVQNIGAYASEFFPMTFRLYAYEDQDGQAASWIRGWTLFYWAWWISWSPYVGMFIARISRGRTVREFILSVLFVPAGFTFMWMTVFGNTAISMDMATDGMLSQIIAEDYSIAIFMLLERLPLGTITALVATVLVITFFVTSSDSGSLVIDIITSGGHPNPPVWQRVFWAMTEGFVAAVLLIAGGQQTLAALQTASITSALPFTVVMLFICYGLYRGLSVDQVARTYRMSPPQQALPIQGTSASWEQRLNTIIRHYTREEAERFLTLVAKPALDEIATYIREKGLEATVKQGPDQVELTVFHGMELDFRYGVRLRGYRAPSFVYFDIDDSANGNRRHYRAEVHLLAGPADYDIMGYTKDELIGDLVSHYNTHMEVIHVGAEA